MTRRRFLRALAGLGGLALFAACGVEPVPSPTRPARPSPPPTSPPPASPTGPTAPTASPAAPPTLTARPQATATVLPAPTPAATGTAAAAPRIYLPEIGRAPPPIPTVPPPTAPPQPAAPPPTPGTPQPTETPRPTPPPVPTTGPRLPIAKITKWGLGVYREGNEVFDDLYVAKPTTILLMDPTPGWAQRVRQWFPNAFIVGRIFRTETAQPLDNPGARGAAFADTVASAALPLKGTVDAWMSYNEAVGHNAHEDYRRYNEFQVAFARRLQDEHGVAAVANNDGSGAVEPDDYPRYFADAIRACRYFGVHAYSPPATNRMTTDAEWNALRYRKIHDALERAGIPDKKMVITESGLGDGWLGRVDDVIMAEEFFWFTDELQKDKYVIGHAAYGLFGGVTGLWKNFELRATDVLNRMGHYEPPPRRR
ncbi:MAG TPA: hypothetical protein VGM69_15135 [Chloroflexota bacterium]